MAPRTGVLPGSKFKLAKVTLTDQQGKSRSPEAGQEVTVEVKGGTYDAATQEVHFSADRSEVPADGYEVAVVHPDGARSVQRFKADFARVDGPDPEDVAAFDASLMWRKDGALYEIPEGMSLIPGEEYELHAQANDVHGRTFESTDGDYPIPGNRLDKTLTGFHPSDLNENGLIAEDGLAAGQVYKVDVAYVGENGQRKSLAFNYDPAIPQGPAPEMVAGARYRRRAGLREPDQSGSRQDARSESHGYGWPVMEPRHGRQRIAFDERISPPSVPPQCPDGERRLRPCDFGSAVQSRRARHAGRDLPSHRDLRGGPQACGRKDLFSGLPQHRADHGGRRTRLHGCGRAFRQRRPGWTAGVSRE